MYTSLNPRNPVSSVLFVDGVSGKKTTTFNPGQTVCISCGSTNLHYYDYVDDAKCNCCRQWQNEDVMHDYVVLRSSSSDVVAVTK